MRKSLFNCILMLTAAFILFSCASTKNNVSEDSVVVSTDSKNAEFAEYDNNRAITDEVTPVEDSSVSSNGLTINIKDKIVSDNSFISKFSSLSNFCEYNDVTVYSMNALNKLKQYDSVMVYVPKSDTFGFGSTYLAAYCYMHFDDDGRAAFKKAFNQYYSDFENKRLNRNDKKSMKAYGSSKANIHWGSIKANCINYGTGDITFGYKFIGSSPYFSINMYPIMNERLERDSTAPKESMKTTFYFTKAACKAVLDNLDSEVVDAVRRAYNGTNYGKTSFDDSDDGDVY